MPWVSIVVVGVVVVDDEGLVDLTAFVMQEEFGKGFVESIAIKLTYMFRNYDKYKQLDNTSVRFQKLPHAAQAVRPGDWKGGSSQSPIVLSMSR